MLALSKQPYYNLSRPPAEIKQHETDVSVSQNLDSAVGECFSVKVKQLQMISNILQIVKVTINDLIVDVRIPPAVGEIVQRIALAQSFRRVL